MLTRKFLHREYVKRNRELRDIAAQAGVSHETVRTKLNLHGIPLRNRGTRAWLRYPLIQAVLFLHRTGNTSARISTRLGVASQALPYSLGSRAGTR